MIIFFDHLHILDKNTSNKTKSTITIKKAKGAGHNLGLSFVVKDLQCGLVKSEVFEGSRVNWFSKIWKKYIIQGFHALGLRHYFTKYKIVSTAIPQLMWIPIPWFPTTYPVMVYLGILRIKYFHNVIFYRIFAHCEYGFFILLFILFLSFLVLHSQSKCIPRS